MMRSTHLTPPQITELSLRLKSKGKVGDIKLRVSEMVAELTPRLSHAAEQKEV